MATAMASDAAERASSDAARSLAMDVIAHIAHTHDCSFANGAALMLMGVVDVMRMLADRAPRSKEKLADLIAAYAATARAAPADERATVLAAESAALDFILMAAPEPARKDA
jgi:hypothetical protein